MKTIDMRITGSDDVVICPSVVRDALQNYFPEKYFTVTELPPQVEERSCENCEYKILPADTHPCLNCFRAYHGHYGHCKPSGYFDKWQPAAPGAPDVSCAEECLLLQKLREENKTLRERLGVAQGYVELNELRRGDKTLLSILYGKHPVLNQPKGEE